MITPARGPSASANSLRSAVNIHLASSMAGYHLVEQAARMPLRTRSPQHAHAARAGAQLTFAASHLAALHFLRRQCATRRPCSPSTAAWGQSSRSSGRLEPAPPLPLSVDVPFSFAGVSYPAVPFSALCHFPDRHLPPTGNIRMSKTSAPDALSMPRCATCSDHALNVSARPAFRPQPGTQGVVRPRRADVLVCSVVLSSSVVVDVYSYARLCIRYTKSRAKAGRALPHASASIGLVVLTVLQCCSCSGRTSENPSGWQCCSGWQSYNVLCYATLLLCPSRAGQHAS